MLCGVYLIVVAGWVLLVIGAASILAGVLYTGGPRPYGYEGLGEVFVFLFFGVVAVTGSYYVAGRASCTWEALALAVPVGLLAAAILVVNNVRDSRRPMRGRASGRWPCGWGASVRGISTRRCVRGVLDPGRRVAGGRVACRAAGAAAVVGAAAGGAAGADGAPA